MSFLVKAVLNRFVTAPHAMTTVTAGVPATSQQANTLRRQASARSGHVSAPRRAAFGGQSAESPALSSRRRDHASAATRPAPAPAAALAPCVAWDVFLLLIGRKLCFFLCRCQRGVTSARCVHSRSGLARGRRAAAPRFQDAEAASLGTSGD